MKRSLLYCAILLLIFANSSQLVFAQELLDKDYFQSLKYSHDLNLPNWGPYTKKYIGVSHIPDKEQGTRFDLSVFPGFYRRKVDVPNVFHESGFHPWEASPNLEYFSFRHELEWKDRVYADVSYSEIDANSRLIRMECVNNTEYNQSIVLHLMASVHFASIQPYAPDQPIYKSKVSLPSNVVWVDALDYKELVFKNPSFRDRLAIDGMMNAEIREDGLINGSGIGKSRYYQKGFGEDVGDYVIYEFPSSKNIKEPVLYLRYRIEKGKTATLTLAGLLDRTIELSGSGNFEIKTIEISKPLQDDNSLKIESISTQAISFDGFVVVGKEDISKIKIIPQGLDYVPEIINGPDEKSVVLKYKNIDNYYGIYWDFPDYQVREWQGQNLSDYFKRMVNNHVRKKFFEDSLGHFTNIFLNPIHLKAKSKTFIDAIVCTGTKEEVLKQLKKAKSKDTENIYQSARKSLSNFNAVPDGEKYVFSQKRMAATTITNVVYPVYTQKQYIRHHAPGRWWDCLYTWDSGFIGLGLSQLSTQRGFENLNAYLNETDEQSVFIHHGTPLPVQHYLFLELWNKTQNEEFLKEFYPKLKNYYEFLTGKIESSNTNNLNSGLIRTWDYFYNSGGWDDYPPQKFVHQAKLTDNVTPVVSTAQCIRIAKILKMAAFHQNLKNDVRIYDKDIKSLSEALHNHSWDETTGYFGFVTHDENKNADGILKYQDSINYNMGLGGSYPLFSGICNEKQQRDILSHLKTKGEIWSDVGLSAVDQSAPYYSNNGYWNGTVWMPHQWFFWKSMLDLGEDKFAYEIAKTALDTWKRETEKTYNSFEHFVIETGNGAGWHQFGGLSCPVLSWFSSYYMPGHLTGGYDIWLTECEFSPENDSLLAKMNIFDRNKKNFSLLVCMNPEYDYTVYWNNKKVTYNQLHKGTLSISLEKSAKTGMLKIEKK